LGGRGRLLRAVLAFGKVSTLGRFTRDELAKESEATAVAETTKLSDGQALDKLRGTEAPKTKMTRLDEKIDDLDKEAQRLRAMRRSLGPKTEPSTKR